ncbi:MAG: hypothetical protein O3C21_01720 [Verrucomicrobia bacterium]|nr:hypothetical protein [Verrucomicrobiota bacterium]
MNWKAVLAAGFASLAHGQVGSGDAGDEFERVALSYGNLVTVAGTGLAEDSNDWRAEFEGGKGTDVELSNPHMTMADAAGNLYIADKESNSVLKLTPGGIVTTFAGTHEPGKGEGKATDAMLNQPNGLFAFPDGTVYVLDIGNRRVCKVSREGVLSTVLEDAGISLGRGLWVEEGGGRILYNAGANVMEWKPDGGSEALVGGFSDLGNIALDPEGRLVVTDRGAHRVYRIGPDGTKTVIAGNGGEEEPVSGRPATEVGLEEVRGIAFRSDGSFFVCTQKGGDVVFVDTNGLAHLFIAGTRSGNTRAGEGEPVTTPGDKIAEPRAVALAPNGDLIVTTNDTGYVRVVRALRPPSGQSIRKLADSGLMLAWERVEGTAVAIQSSGDLASWDTVQARNVGEEWEHRPDPANATATYFRLLPQR